MQLIFVHKYSKNPGAYSKPTKALSMVRDQKESSNFNSEEIGQMMGDDSGSSNSGKKARLLAEQHQRNKSNYR